jgi:hypothetical protein
MTFEFTSDEEIIEAFETRPWENKDKASYGLEMLKRGLKINDEDFLQLAIKYYSWSSELFDPSRLPKVHDSLEEGHPLRALIRKAFKDAAIKTKRDKKTLEQITKTHVRRGGEWRPKSSKGPRHTKPKR